jgi:serine/threonine protein phosphatase PrpC
MSVREEASETHLYVCSAVITMLRQGGRRGQEAKSNAVEQKAKHKERTYGSPSHFQLDNIVTSVSCCRHVLMQFATAIRSSTGGRSKNQDTADHFSHDGLEGWVLADGLGGHRGGGLASSLAADAMIDACRDGAQLSEKTIQTAAQAAQEILHERQKKHPEYSRMRTTFVLLLADPDAPAALWAHAGDSRLYQFRDGAVVAQTKDHSAVQALVDAGELAPDEMRDHGMGHRITRCLGDSGKANPDVAESTASIQPGDAFLLCSDGFWEGVTEERMLDTLDTADSPEDWIDTMAAPIEEAAERDQDNYTAVAVFAEAS